MPARPARNEPVITRDRETTLPPVITGSFFLDGLTEAHTPDFTLRVEAEGIQIKDNWIRGTSSLLNLSFVRSERSYVSARRGKPALDERSSDLDLPAVPPIAPANPTFAESQTSPETCLPENAWPDR